MRTTPTLLQMAESEMRGVAMRQEVAELKEQLDSAKVGRGEVVDISPN